MIVRCWRARAAGRPAAEAYAHHLREHVLPQLAVIDGYRGARLLCRQERGSFELLVLTMWASREAIQAFAGEDVEAAVVAPEARALLAEFDARVRHYELLAQHEP